jgi:palmitoyl-protein thioesterase
MDAYLKYNEFLADINNEYSVKNSDYSKRLTSLNRFIMVQFAEDTMVVPKESSVIGLTGF